MKRIVRLYPSAWRRRYGEELIDLLEEVPATPATTVDLLRGAAVMQFRALVDRVAPRLASAGGPPIPTHALQRHPTATALIAALITAPTIIFVVVSFLAYQVELPGMHAWLQPFMDGLARAPRIVDVFLLGAPFLAFLIAALPLIGLRMERVDGDLRITLAVRARTLNLIVLAVCVLVGGFLASHLLVEFLFERP
ncbi:MAG: hypothetical protein H0W81_08100 [Chloroflexi bacterium]|nr:hypothetical protein [Chloroflexota bacterium]